MRDQYVEQTWESSAFTCPHCGAYAEQLWPDTHYGGTAGAGKQSRGWR